MKIKIFGILAVIVLLFGSFTVAETEKTGKSEVEICEISFSTPEIHENGRYVYVSPEGTNSIMRHVGKPMLPFFSKTMIFPLGTKIKSIEYTCSQVKTMIVNKKIQPASRPLPTNMKNRVETTMDNEVYNSMDPYPKVWYSYSTSGGLDRDENHVTFLTINFYPIRYISGLNILEYVENIKTVVTYEEVSQPLIHNDEYDLVIISYDQYASLLEPLVSHKESYNIRTKLVTLSDIYNSVYFSVKGRDNPEKIKYFIKDAVENWGITYVMLVGNFRKMPVRYVNLETDKGGQYEELEFLSDLYYADIYDGEGSFCSWDSDDDGVYGEWPYPDIHLMEDTVDLCPDVYVGRLACMWGFEVRTLVNKIIDYEENTNGQQWFKNMIVCGGDTFNDSEYGCDTDYLEGEEGTQKALEFMDGFNPIKLWVSMGNLNEAAIRQAINSGGGFIYFCGHGNPAKWSTHPPGSNTWVGDYNNQNVCLLRNKGKYPILMVGGCHNSQFDVNLLNLLRNPKKAWYFSTWVPECWSWVFVRKNGGGAIASMGSTGYGCCGICDYDHDEISDYVQYYDGWFETQFFRLYNEENLDILGETYGQTVTDYVKKFPVYTYRYDCKVVETHVLFGDPSLKIGGYT